MYLIIIYFVRNNLHFKKLIQLITQSFNWLIELLKKIMLTLGVSIDLSKGFDTVDHMILIKKLDYYGVKGRDLLWFKSYFNNSQQFITYNNSNTSFANISCGILQGWMQGPLLFLLYINDLPNASPVLYPVIYADGTNYSIPLII